MILCIKILIFYDADQPQYPVGWFNDQELKSLIRVGRNEIRINSWFPLCRLDIVSSI